MKEKLISYVNLLFAGTADCDDIRQEILQNTLDRYDDLLDQGKTPEAAYRLAIGGIGDINELLGQEPPAPETPTRRDTPGKKGMRAVAVALYILCPLPLLALADSGLEIYGLCGLLTFVAVATALMMLGSPGKGSEIREERPMSPREERPMSPRQERPMSPRQDLWRGVRSLASVVTVAVYLGVSFLTRAWYITWLIFPIAAALEGIIKAILDLREEVSHEN